MKIKEFLRVGAFSLASMTVPIQPAVAADQVILKSLQVKTNLRAGVPYAVALPISVTGHPRIINACFYWSWEGPYCFNARYNKTKSQLELKLRTGNPNTYELKAYVQYDVGGGKVIQSNQKSKTIKVK